MSQAMVQSARRAQATVQGKRLFVSGVAPEARKTDLQKEFGEFGFVVEIELPMTARNVAFVDAAAPWDAVLSPHSTCTFVEVLTDVGR